MSVLVCVLVCSLMGMYSKRNDLMFLTDLYYFSLGLANSLAWLYILVCILCRHEASLLNWALPADTFPCFVQLLSVPVYTHSVLLGMTVSVGGLTESLVSTDPCLSWYMVWSVPLWYAFIFFQTLFSHTAACVKIVTLMDCVLCLYFMSYDFVDLLEFWLL